MAKKKSEQSEKGSTVENTKNSIVMIDSKSKGNVTNQVLQGDSLDKLDLKKLAEELAVLRTAMKDIAQDADQDIALGEVAQAEKAAKANDREGLMQHLKNAGAWTLDVATKIAVPLAVEALKIATGMK